MLFRSHGVYFAMGGTGALTKALGDLMSRHGVKLRLNTTVSSIKIGEGVAKGVVLEDGTEIEADVVVSNADAAHLHQNMIKSVERSWMSGVKLKAAHYSMGLYVLYFGTKKKYKDVAHHTIWMGKRYRELLEDIFHKKILAEDFSLYVHRPTATDPSFAPEGCDSFYVLCPVPNMQSGIDWSVEEPRLRARIIQALDETILPGLKESITAVFAMTPADFKTHYQSLHGAGFSIAPIFRQSAWFRFHNQAEGIKHLYLVGAGTHPGAGLTGVLCSAKVIDALIPQAQ